MNYYWTNYCALLPIIVQRRQHPLDVSVASDLGGQTIIGNNAQQFDSIIISESGKNTHETGHKSLLYAVRFHSL